jgi:putative ABC transport system ATP-binding protein
MVTLSDIHVVFSPGTIRERKALNGLSLKIEEGEFLTVIGSNGAGKSTLLNTIAGEILPTSGTIKIDYDDVTQKESYARSDAVARVFQDPLSGTCGDLTIAENVALAMARGRQRFFKKALPRARRDEIAELLKQLNLGLENRLDTLIGSLSGGQRQAISLLMATLSPLKILLLDEHTSALDPKTAAFVMDLSKQIIAEHKLTALMVTHSLQQALDVGTRTVMLHEGNVIFDVCGEKRDELTVNDLLAQFGKSMDDDRLLLQRGV